eukprot:14651730-Heterocapsa_arctica.AAC.1
MLKCNIDANIVSNYISRRSKDKLERGNKITTLNLSGSLLDFEWILENTEDQIILIQEHWRLPNELEPWRSAAFRKGWTGIWHPAIRTQKTVEGHSGRSGGVAIL